MTTIICNDYFCLYQTNMAAPLVDSDQVERNLHLLHFEILRVQNECNVRNLSCFQIRKAASSFFSQKQPPRNRLKTFIIVSSILTCLLATIIYVEPVSRFTIYMRRQILLKTLPVLDWRSLHGVACFFANRYKVEDIRQLQVEECQNCSSITNVGILTEPDTEEIINGYLNNDIPVNINLTVTDEKTLTIEDIIELYLDDDVMRMYTSCDFNSNVRVKKNDHRVLLKNIREGKTTQYFGLWGNCFTEPAKLFRQVYKRPDFLSMSLELVASNGIYICSNFSSDEPAEVPFIEEVMILMQLSGSQNIKLKPKDPCHETCKSLETTLTEGGSLILTDYFYDIEFMSCGNDSTITVQLGAKWDS